MTELLKQPDGVENWTPEIQVSGGFFDTHSPLTARLLPIELEKTKAASGFKLPASNAAEFMEYRRDEWNNLQRSYNARDLLHALFVEAYYLYCFFVVQDPSGRAALALLPTQKQADFKHSHLATVALWLVMSKVKGNNYRNRKALREVLLQEVHPEVLRERLRKRELTIGKLANAFDARGFGDDGYADAESGPKDPNLSPPPTVDSATPFARDTILDTQMDACATTTPPSFGIPEAFNAGAEATETCVTNKEALHEAGPANSHPATHFREAVVLFDADLNHHASHFAVGDVVTLTAVVIDHKTFQVGDISKMPSIPGYVPRFASKVRDALRLSARKP